MPTSFAYGMKNPAGMFKAIHPTVDSACYDYTLAILKSPALYHLAAITLKPGQRSKTNMSYVLEIQQGWQIDHSCTVSSLVQGICVP